MNKDKSRHINKYKILGQNIRKLRNNKQMSQEELAFRISSTRNYIGCIERCEKVPSLAFVFDIAEGLNCTLMDLLENI